MGEIRPIDANALKENLLKNLRCDTCYKVQLINIIDNAPTLNLEKTSFMKGYNYGCDDGKRFYERPQGKWIRKCNEHRVDICCTNCGYDDGYSCFKFCPNCGADMQKEDNE